MRTLVTGSSGFLGRHLADACRARGDLVVEVDIKEGVDCRSFFRRGIHYAQQGVFSDVLHEPYDLVLHCAAMVGGREGIDHQAALLGAYNLQLDGAMFEWALAARPGRVVYFSSAAAYSTRLQERWAASPAGFIRLSEAAARPGAIGMPDESYGWAKLTGEMTAARVRRAGVPVTVVRPFSSYDHDQDDCYPFPEFMHRAARRDDPFDVWGPGDQLRDLIHVDDVVGAVLRLVELGISGPVNLGTGRATSMDDLARLAMRTAGYEAPIRHLVDKPVGVHARVADVTHLGRFYRPTVSLEAGVRRAIDVIRGSDHAA